MAKDHATQASRSRDARAGPGDPAQAIPPPGATRAGPAARRPDRRAALLAATVATPPTAAAAAPRTRGGGGYAWCRAGSENCRMRAPTAVFGEPYLTRANSKVYGDGGDARLELAAQSACCDTPALAPATKSACCA